MGNQSSTASHNKEDHYKKANRIFTAAFWYNESTVSIRRVPDKKRGNTPLFGYAVQREAGLH